jgi:hypothetical protein
MTLYRRVEMPDGHIKYDPADDEIERPADDPVILVGTNRGSGVLEFVGLYKTDADAMIAVQSGRIPGGCHWSIMTPPMGQIYRRHR